MQKITLEYLMDIHRYAIKSGVRDELKLKDAVLYIGTLEYIVDKANRIDDELSRASFLLYSVANHHPFVEGNKRTALLLAEVTLRKCYIEADGPEVNRMVRRIAAGELNEQQTKEWIKERCRKFPH
jgi:death-on-curing protein